MFTTGTNTTAFLKYPKAKLSTLHAEAFELCSNVPWVNLYAECLKIAQYYKIVVFGAVNGTSLVIFKHCVYAHLRSNYGFGLPLITCLLIVTLHENGRFGFPFKRPKKA